MIVVRPLGARRSFRTAIFGFSGVVLPSQSSETHVGISLAVGSSWVTDLHDLLLRRTEQCPPNGLQSWRRAVTKVIVLLGGFLLISAGVTSGLRALSRAAVSPVHIVEIESHHGEAPYVVTIWGFPINHVGPGLPAP